ncbi:hypothetical protein [Streptosporangium vulgare]|uniref:hypothetical protein n=1 Tax=Streptosporangium vulgare TaxID=46190 RepID=UPI0031D9D10D
MITPWGDMSSACRREKLDVEPGGASPPVHAVQGDAVAAAVSRLGLRLQHPLRPGQELPDGKADVEGGQRQPIASSARSPHSSSAPRAPDQHPKVGVDHGHGIAEAAHHRGDEEGGPLELVTAGG